jgi:hypothetical protein
VFQQIGYNSTPSDLLEKQNFNSIKSNVSIDARHIGYRHPFFKETWIIIQGVVLNSWGMCG